MSEKPPAVQNEDSLKNHRGPTLVGLKLTTVNHHGATYFIISEEL